MHSLDRCGASHGRLDEERLDQVLSFVGMK
jgi:hypothetical protein